MLQLPREGWWPLACLNGASPDFVIVVVEWLNYSKRISIVGGADLGEKNVDDLHQ